MGIFKTLAAVPAFERTAEVAKDDVPNHDKWIVITTINDPTDQVRKLAATKSGWKVVVVGDLATPPDWAWKNCVYLSPQKQKELGYSVVDRIPWNFYTRKNIGYLYAIQHGAKTIYDTDDDNVIKGDDPLVLPECLSEVPVADSGFRTVNPHIYFGETDSWPRGFPLQDIKQKGSRHYRTNKKKDIRAPIQQGLVNGDPDVDAIQRLTSFVRGSSFVDVSDALVLSQGTMSPFNSQNTVFHYSAFWGLMLPSTTTFRVCDIWRGYWNNRLLWEIGAHLAFLKASAIQDRNSHSLLQDFADEVDLYEYAGSLVDYLIKWRPRKGDSLPKIMDTLMWDLVFKGYIEKDDAITARAWLQDLANIGYKFPATTEYKPGSEPHCRA